MSASTRKRGPNWTQIECEVVVRDYFKMLYLELAGKPYSKTETRRKIRPLLSDRSDSSIEYKRENISAILLELGEPYIIGYKPAKSYQKLLKEVVEGHLAAHRSDHEKLVDYVLGEIDIPDIINVNWENVLDERVAQRVMESDAIGSPEPEVYRSYKARPISFTEKEHSNRRLGEMGEKFVVEYEKNRLIQMERRDLADEVEWSSNEHGDGLGYDVRSFNKDRPDEELYIEVKTTTGGEYQPFYITENEAAFSRDYARQYSLYRVFDFKRQARLFPLPGAVEKYVHLLPQNYKAIFPGNSR